MSQPTQFEQDAINKAAESHREMVEALKGRLTTLRVVVDGTLATSPSGATRALQTTYDTWINDVEKMIITRVDSLSEAMKKTAATQADIDEQNRTGISAVAEFIHG